MHSEQPHANFTLFENTVNWSLVVLTWTGSRSDLPTAGSTPVPSAEPGPSSSEHGTAAAVDVCTADATSCSNCTKLAVNIETLSKQLTALRRTCSLLRLRHKRSLRKLRILSRAQASDKCGVNKFLRPDQTRALGKKSTRGSKWSSATTKKSLALYFACGPTGYAELLSQNYPLPSRWTLLRSLQHVKFESVILYEVFQYLSVKTLSMPTEERCCV